MAVLTVVVAEQPTHPRKTARSRNPGRSENNLPEKQKIRKPQAGLIAVDPLNKQ
jgi:hypothetical protein